uniref:Uncharacterized protein n=1 Tax=Oryza sativa subsp. japonica TaxID=39947 RepID=Q6ZE16_ORYSJ|nr:hypothetical protein [Oryza sativa Japonica Group]
MHRRALHRCLRTAPSLAGIRRALRAGLGRALRRSRWRAPLEPSAAASSPFAEPNVVPPVEPSAAASSPSRSPAGSLKLDLGFSTEENGRSDNTRALFSVSFNPTPTVAPSQRATSDGQCASSAKTALHTAIGRELTGFRKLEDGSYPVLRSKDENRSGQQIEGPEGPKVNLFQS